MAVRQPTEKKPRIKVWLVRDNDRPNFRLVWIEPSTGLRRSKSTGTADRVRATAERVLLEDRLNAERPRLPVGHVYLVEGADGQFKIGKAINPRARLAALQAASPVRLTLVHFIITDDMSWLERQWHRKFNNCRLIGEWFGLDIRRVARFKRVILWYRDMAPFQGRPIEDPWYQ